MGFVLEVYSNNMAGLSADFQQRENSETYCNTDSIKEAMDYFKLFIDKNNVLKIRDANDDAIDVIGIKPEEAEELRTTLDGITGIMTNEEAMENLVLFKIWKPDTKYQSGDKSRHNDKLYECIQGHTSQNEWPPPVVPALWKPFYDVEYPEWVQPIGSHDAYGKGDPVTHNGKRWISEIDANTWEPGVYGWREVVE